MNSENIVVIELATCACNDPTAVFERGTRGSSALIPHEAVLNWSKDVEDGASEAPFNNTSCALDLDKPLGILCHTCAKTMQHIPTRCVPENQGIWCYLQTNCGAWLLQL